MKPYTDKKGTTIKSGDMLLYDEGPGGTRQIHVVVSELGYLCGTVVLSEEGERVHGDQPILLRWYTTGGCGTVCIHATVIPRVDLEDLGALRAAWAFAD